MPCLQTPGASGRLGQSAARNLQCAGKGDPFGLSPLADTASNVRDDAPLWAPAFEGLIGEIAEHADQPARPFDLLLGLVRRFGDDHLQPRVLCESDHMAYIVVFAPREDRFGTETATWIHAQGQRARIRPTIRASSGAPHATEHPAVGGDYPPPKGAAISRRGWS